MCLLHNSASTHRIMDIVYTSVNIQRERITAHLVVLCHLVGQTGTLLYHDESVYNLTEFYTSDHCRLRLVCWSIIYFLHRWTAADNLPWTLLLAIKHVPLRFWHDPVSCTMTLYILSDFYSCCTSGNRNEYSLNGLMTSRLTSHCMSCLFFTSLCYFLELNMLSLWPWRH